MAKTLDEVCCPTGETPTFPAKCPECGAERVIPSAKNSGKFMFGAEYACGATYESKPQIQNHTDKWWGSCPKN